MSTIFWVWPIPSNFLTIDILVVSCILEAKILFFLAVKIFQMIVFGESQLNLVQGSQIQTHFLLLDSFEPGILIPYESRQKTLWLQDAVIQRRYNDCNREPSAYLSNKEAITQFPFMERQINREALRITRMGDRKSTSKSGYDPLQIF